MNPMFFKARDFNQDLNSWDVSKVTDMSNMFEEASDAFQWRYQCLECEQCDYSWIECLIKAKVLSTEILNSWNVSKVTDTRLRCFEFSRCFSMEILVIGM